jgi:hypothetical protein
VRRPPCEGQRDHANGSRERTLHTMALDQSALLEVLEVSRICAELDVEVAAFRDRSLSEQPFRYVFSDATYCKARVAIGSSLRRSWWPPASRPTGAARCSGSTSVIARTVSSGPRSSGR